MHRFPALALAALLLGTATQASATALESCCACIPANGGATTSGAPSGTATAAFCAEADGANLGELTDRCAALPGYALACVLNIPGPTCFEQLADEDVVCPTVPAPALAPFGMAAGFLLLSGIGVLALRRR